MSNEKLVEQLNKLKQFCSIWEKELETFSKWAIENDGVITPDEQSIITNRKLDIDSIKKRILVIENAKNIAQTASQQTSASTEKPKNKLGLTSEDVKTKLSDFFAAFDKITVVVEGKNIEVETPYFMNDGKTTGTWDGNTVTAGKGSPKEVQEWLQKKINEGKIKSQDPSKLRQYLKDNKIGVDCSGFVSQALNHVADKEGDMDFEKGEDPFMPDNTGSGTFTGSKFTKISAKDVQIGDTLYFKNPSGGVNHIRIVGDVRKENNTVYYTIYESAGRTGPRKMEWKFEEEKLQEFSSNKWVTKTNDTFYRWNDMEMSAPTGGGAGTGQQQDQQNNNNSNTQPANTGSTISESVGKEGKNVSTDVKIVQTLLKKHGYNVNVDGDCGPKTIAAIESFQLEKAGFSKADGKVDPGGKTWKKLLENPTSNTSSGAGNAPEENSQNTNTNNNTNNTVVEEVLSPTSSISQSVGAGGKNLPEDVLKVKQLLNKFGNKLELNGTADNALTEAIKDFQTKYKGSAKPDGRIDKGGETWNALLGIGRLQGQLDAMATQYVIEKAVILAVQEVEASGNGFLTDGRPKILFEGHVFWRLLKKAGKDPEKLKVGNEDILYPAQDSSKYDGGAKEYDRLEKAKKIDEKLALQSASWGEFQIMGFNHATVGYSDVYSFVEAMKIPNGNSLKAMLEFCKKNNLIKFVSGTSKDWASFAKGYNGPGYAKNSYDTKMANAYERYKKI